jgi:predicted Zn-dependent protease
MTRTATLARALACALLATGCETVAGAAGGLRGLPGTAGRVTDATSRAAQAAPKVQGALADIDEPEEIEIGRAVTASIGARYRVVRDPAPTRYVALVGNAVAARSPRPDLRYYFAVLDSDEVNALAAPGGSVFVTRGALRVMGDEATLAGVLGHEIAHVALRHGVDAIRAQKQKELALFTIREGVAQTRAAGFTNVIASTADFFTEQVVLKGYSREVEAESDRAGFRYARDAGYDAAGLRDFLSALLDRDGERDATRATFFSTHPGTRERRDEQSRLLASAPPGGRRNPDRCVAAVRF